MNDDFYKQLIQEAPTGYAYHRIICDEDGIPCDYEYIEVNAAFEKLTGLKGSDIVGRRATGNTGILPVMRTNEFDSIHFYGEIAINGGKKEFEHFSEPLNKWYKVNVYSPEKYYFITQFIDITNEINQFTEMERLVEISEEFLQMDEQKICYKKISDDFMKICGAKYASFNLFDENGKGFTTMAISGDKGIIKKASNILGLKIENKKWEHDPIRSEKIKARTITRFNSLSELVGSALPIPLVALLEKTFNIGETVLIKILKNNIIIGDFTLIMEKGKMFDKDTLAEIYTRQLGIVITRKKAEDLLKVERERLENIIQGTNSGT